MYCFSVNLLQGIERMMLHSRIFTTTLLLLFIFNFSIIIVAYASIYRRGLGREKTENFLLMMTMDLSLIHKQFIKFTHIWNLFNFHLRVNQSK